MVVCCNNVQIKKKKWVCLYKSICTLYRVFYNEHKSNIFLYNSVEGDNCSSAGMELAEENKSTDQNGDSQDDIGNIPHQGK